MTIISKEILSMMYAKVSELKFDNKSTYWCTEGGNRYDIIIFCNNDTGETVQYEDVVKYTTRRNVGFIELKRRAVVFDLNTLKEIKSYDISMKCQYIYDEAVAIPMKDRLVVYSVNKNRETFNEECKCSNGWVYNAKGRVYDFINFETAAIIVKRDGTVGKLIKAKDGLMLNCASDKGTYCDLVITESTRAFSTSNYMDSRNCFVCGSNIYTLEEYLKEITVKSYEADIKITEINDIDVESIAGYNVTLENGYKGYLSYDLRRLKIDGFRGNILDTTFEYYKKAHLQ